jgi:hypothetical protein
MNETSILQQQDKDLEQWKADSYAYLMRECGADQPWNDATSDKTTEEE